MEAAYLDIGPCPSCGVGTNEPCVSPVGGVRAEVHGGRELNLRPISERRVDTATRDAISAGSRIHETWCERTDPHDAPRLCSRLETELKGSFARASDPGIGRAQALLALEHCKAPSSSAEDLAQRRGLAFILCGLPWPGGEDQPRANPLHPNVWMIRKEMAEFITQLVVRFKPGRERSVAIERARETLLWAERAEGLP